MRPEGGGTEISTRCEIVVSRAIVKAVLTGTKTRGIEKGIDHRTHNVDSCKQEGNSIINSTTPEGILISAQ